ncbi:MAG: hypothetical protein A3E87_05375 [Gammaproteobacteria bacterium RIFCSPHIGHO2_12_FULL_35_23]|nr:MAG: hypothetical protein A3E87_05375 [Gammaproteobacteria bacterium RIFCSPHIGHO2_12_FULL_35_23]
MSKQISASLTSAQQKLNDLWEEHTRCEFETKDTAGTVATMTKKAHVNHVPTMTGGVGLKEIEKFYAQSFIPKMPKDTETILISRTIGETQIVDELIFKFTHDIVMDWMLPGIAPTGKKVAIALVAIVGFQSGKVSHEHIYWDQASVLVQLGLIDAKKLPVVGVEGAEKIKNPNKHASNQLINRAAKD